MYTTNDPTTQLSTSYAPTHPRGRPSNPPAPRDAASLGPWPPPFHTAHPNPPLLQITDRQARLPRPILRNLGSLLPGGPCRPYEAPGLGSRRLPKDGSPPYVKDDVVRGGLSYQNIQIHIYICVCITCVHVYIYIHIAYIVASWLHLKYGPILPRQRRHPRRESSRQPFPKHTCPKCKCHHHASRVSECIDMY